MPTTLDLTTLSTASLRLLVTCCAAAAGAHATDAQRKALWQRLEDHAWTPTTADSPLPLAIVATWVDESQPTLRQWLDTHVLREEGR